MDAKVRAVIDALTACGAEMRQHAEWILGVMRRTAPYWHVPGEYENNVAAASDIQKHARLMDVRIEDIERQWLERGEHSTRCGTGADYPGCTPWCKFREAVPVEAPRVIAETPRPMPQAPAPKPKEPEPEPKDRFTLIELE